MENYLLMSPGLLLLSAAVMAVATSLFRLRMLLRHRRQQNVQTRLTGGEVVRATFPLFAGSLIAAVFLIGMSVAGGHLANYFSQSIGN